MLDLDKELNDLNIPFRELHHFGKAPAYPYGVYDDAINERGNDEKLTIVEHDTTLELYSLRVNKDAERVIEKWLNDKNFEFKRNRIWIDSEKHFMTIYEFSFIEKKGE